ncbi:hypothetical protein [Anaeromyxobacter oryzisoli]|uniref:hypothetical protein n=1 Tax=Anaeromyxobacter oryzisoli TaxID=2925408 RepID=UPI001F5AAA04|nr:hypothetical protein [Anaeromyxobacter sp. SG63]
MNAALTGEGGGMGRKTKHDYEATDASWDQLFEAHLELASVSDQPDADAAFERAKTRLRKAAIRYGVAHAPRPSRTGR